MTVYCYHYLTTITCDSVQHSQINFLALSTSPNRTLSILEQWCRVLTLGTIQAYGRQPGAHKWMRHAQIHIVLALLLYTLRSGMARHHTRQPSGVIDTRGGQLSDGLTSTDLPYNDGVYAKKLHIFLKFQRICFAL